MEAEADTALIPASGKERIEGFAPDIETHAATIVGKADFDIVVPECLHPDVMAPPSSSGRRVRPS